MSSDPSSRNNPGLYQGGRHPSSYNPNRLGLTSEISGELTAYAIRAPLPCGLVFPLQFPVPAELPRSCFYNCMETQKMFSIA